jgi:hypothetical protein
MATEKDSNKSSSSKVGSPTSKAPRSATKGMAKANARTKDPDVKTGGGNTSANDKSKSVKTRGGAGTRSAAGGRRTNEGGNQSTTSGRSGTSRAGRGNDAESTRTRGDKGQYEGSNVSTGSQTPEAVTTPLPQSMDNTTTAGSSPDFNREAE